MKGQGFLKQKTKVKINLFEVLISSRKINTERLCYNELLLQQNTEGIAKCIFTMINFSETLKNSLNLNQFFQHYGLFMLKILKWQ
ncbi:unnamed protein product [Paramecium sonneborni]|uniref:Uncharacterized protein n=1 Tax=Paramecium sonneborni TaxID=65129 RepID=A0A8S1RP12_9CILI|nr:unnamed protein product [Paramecium sonneborni]